ncbi:MAG TPA: serine hydrolase domain-containing protein [Bryobacteraceae bacterium]|nr:serine hydrolase domain-containing protein [Bryobacteraceae bacterium]
MTRRDLLPLTMSLLAKQTRVDEAIRLVEDRVRSGEVAGAVLHFRSKDTNVQRAFGNARTTDSVFLIASITKPMTVTAVMVMVDRGQLKLADPVQKYIPEFSGDGRDKVLVQHLLTHTSGLPDMLPENDELRQRHAGLQEFVARTCRTPLLFPPGTELRYQSMGILLAAEIVQRLSGQPFPEFLTRQVLAPLKMKYTSLGLGSRSVGETMQVQLPAATNWDWNSRYWRTLGAPWGGAHSTAGDIVRFLRYFVERPSGILKADTAAAMITNQTPGLKRSWGYGWMVGPEGLGKDCSSSAFGHSGSTGTMCWLDPSAGSEFVLLTTRPADASNRMLIRPVSDLLSQRD